MSFSAHIIPELKEGVTKGDSMSMYKLAVCYEYGKGVKKDLKKSIELYIQASKKNNTCAMYILGLCYEHGKGVDEDEDKAMEWYRKAASKGHPEAMFTLGWYFRFNHTLSKELIAGAQWISMVV